jgi:hypothetical protein
VYTSPNTRAASGSVSSEPMTCRASRRFMSFPLLPPGDLR